MRSILTCMIILAACFGSIACGGGVMDDSGDHSSNSVKKDSLKSPEPVNGSSGNSGTSNPYNAATNTNKK